MLKRTFIKKDGMRIAALYAPCKDPKALLIACHGFSGRKENSGNFEPFSEKLNQEGFSALAFDFCGNGESDGTFASITLSRQVDDLNTVIEAMSAETSLPIILLGRSFGGSTIIAAGENTKVKAFVLWSAGIYLEDVFRRGLKEQYDVLKSGKRISVQVLQSQIELEPEFVWDLEKYDMESCLKKISSRPVFAIQGSSDFLVAPESIKLIEKSCPQAETHYIEGADHRFEALKAFRDDATITFLKKHF